MDFIIPTIELQQSLIYNFVALCRFYMRPTCFGLRNKGASYSDSVVNILIKRDKKGKFVPVLN
jgi:hypothetical protein